MATWFTGMTVEQIMRNVVYALLPVCAFAIYAFGIFASSLTDNSASGIAVFLGLILFFIIIMILLLLTMTHDSPGCSRVSPQCAREKRLTRRSF